MRLGSYWGRRRNSRRPNFGHEGEVAGLETCHYRSPRRVELPVLRVQLEARCGVGNVRARCGSAFLSSAEPVPVRCWRPCEPLKQLQRHHLHLPEHLGRSRFCAWGSEGVMDCRMQTTPVSEFHGLDGRRERHRRVANGVEVTRSKERRGWQFGK